MEIGIGMRVAEAVTFFEKAAQEARKVVEDGALDGRLEISLYGETNAGGREATVTFNNDDMERDEMTGRIVVDVDA